MHRTPTAPAIATKPLPEAENSDAHYSAGLAFWTQQLHIDATPALSDIVAYRWLRPQA